MSVNWTLEKLQALSADRRLDLFRRASTDESAEASKIVKLIMENDLLVSAAGGLPQEHPVIQQIEKIVSSEAGCASAREAADNGLPAMAGVDPILQQQLGPQYGLYDTTSWAGTFVADQMRRMGYRKTAESRPLPPNCRAKTAAFFERI